MDTNPTESIDLFIPCLVEEVYPEIGIALVALLERLGFAVNFNSAVFCCGQPAFNSGCNDQARAVAQTAVDRLGSGTGPLLVPSGSCTAMMRVFLPGLFAGHSRAAAAESLADRATEVSEFLSAPAILNRISGELNEKIGFHNSCHSARELKIGPQISAILARISGLEIVDVDSGKRDSGPSCCGFGGLFSVRYEPVAGAMARSRLEMFAESGVKRIISNDPGCIMHLRQHAERLGLDLKIEHLVQLLAEAVNPNQSLDRTPRAADELPSGSLSTGGTGQAGGKTVVI